MTWNVAEAVSTSHKAPYDAFMSLVGPDQTLLRFLNRDVLPVAWPGHEVAEVDKGHVYWTPGREFIASHELRWTIQSETAPSRAIMTFAEGGHDLAEVYARQYGRNSDLPNGEPRSAVYLPEARCLVELFPHDWLLPSLAGAMSPGRMRPYLACVSGDRSDLSEWRCDVSVLRYRPHSRSVLSYGVRASDTDEPPGVIGKVYRLADRAARVFAKHRSFHAAARDSGLIVPRPIAFADTLNTVLMERLDGQPMKKLIRRKENSEQMARAAAGALVTLHSMGRETGIARWDSSELVRLGQRVAAVSLIAPEFGAEVNAVLNRIERRASQFEWTGHCLIHGDMKPDNLILVNGDIGLIDFDRLGVGDPAIDVGAFMSKCQKGDDLGKKDGELRLSDYFLDEYQARVGVGGEFAERARTHCGLTFVQRAVGAFLRGYFRTPGATSESEHSKTLLEEASACLG